MYVYQAGYVYQDFQKNFMGPGDPAGDIHHKEVGGARMVTVAYMELVPSGKLTVRPWQSSGLED